MRYHNHHRGIHALNRHFRTVQQSVCLEDLGFQPKKGYRVLEQGFINHKGEFLNRKEAFEHVKEIGQCNATQRWYWEDHAQYELYSEDLY